MAKKNGNSEEMFESPAESGTNTAVSTEPSEPKPVVQAAEKPKENEVRIWVYLGPSIRGIVTNGRVFRGYRAEVIKSLENGLKEYPQIERLIVADREVAKSRNDLKTKRGIYIPYEALIKKITGKED
ncbi:MAG: hypothetical protein ACI4KA_01060 [Oscillospiraceae bacterium]